MNQAEFVTQVYEVVGNYNPDVDEFSTGYQELINQLNKMKDKAMRWEILVSSFKPEPELFPIKERRQGHL